MKPDRPDVIEWVADNVPPAVQDHLLGKLDTCVLSTRIGYDILSYFGIEAKPVVVRAMAFNQKWEKIAQEHPDRLADPDPNKWNDPLFEGAWSVGIDERDHREKGRWPGHLVLHLPGETSYLLDLTVSQFRREQYDMLFPDVLLHEVPASFLDCEPFILEYGPATIGYVYRPGVTSYRQGSDWKGRNHLSGQLIRRAREELTCTTTVV